MSRYQLSYQPEIRSIVDSLPGDIRQRIKRVINDLRDNPYPPAAKQMRNDLQDYWRIQLDDWRIVYTVDEDILIIEVVKVGRKDGPNRGDSFYQGLRPPRRHR